MEKIKGTRDRKVLTFLWGVAVGAGLSFVTSVMVSLR